MEIKDFVPGIKVYAMLKVGDKPITKYVGTVGHAWMAGGKKTLVKFDAGIGWVYITEQNASQFFLEPAN